MGPLVVSASWWQIDSPTLPADDLADDKFLSRIDQWSWQSQFESKVVDGTGTSPPFLVADSKKVYQSGAGLEKLESIVSSLLDAIENRSRLRSVGDSVVLNAVNAVQHPSSPLEADPRRLETSEAAWRFASQRYDWHAQRVQPSDHQYCPYWLAGDGHQQTSGSSFAPSSARRDPTKDWESQTVMPCGLFSALVSEEEFNHGLKQYGNKANLLSATSLCLANQILQRCPVGQTVVIDFDRHGGRKRYLPLLVEYFAADWPQVLGESESESSYVWEQDGRRVLARFTVDGERRYPVAASSLASKYARELGMDCVNAYWQCRIPDLKPSAGYPVDAARMLADLAERIKAMPVPNNKIWRDA